MARFTHIDEEGNARMVDVGQKAVTQRRATATGTITMSPACFDAVVQGTVKKATSLPLLRWRASWVQRRRAASFPYVISCN